MREWGGRGGVLHAVPWKWKGRRAHRVGVLAGSNALPVEADGARWCGAGEEGVRLGGP
jgi:hypothetical protein